MPPASSKPPDDGSRTSSCTRQVRGARRVDSVPSNVVRRAAEYEDTRAPRRADLRDERVVRSAERRVEAARRRESDDCTRHGRGAGRVDGDAVAAVVRRAPRRDHASAPDAPTRDEGVVRAADERRRAARQRESDEPVPRQVLTPDASAAMPRPMSFFAPPRYEDHASAPDAPTFVTKASYGRRRTSSARGGGSRTDRVPVTVAAPDARRRCRGRRRPTRRRYEDRERARRADLRQASYEPPPNVVSKPPDDGSRTAIMPSGTRRRPRQRCRSRGRPRRRYGPRERARRADLVTKASSAPPNVGRSRPTTGSWTNTCTPSGTRRRPPTACRGRCRPRRRYEDRERRVDQQRARGRALPARAIAPWPAAL